MDESQVAAGGMGIGTLIFYALLYVVFGFLAGKILEKAGKPLWAGFVPVYNFCLIAEIAGRPIWWGILMCIPCLGLIPFVIVAMDLAERFGKSKVWGVIFLWLLAPIGLAILAFGDDKYTPPTA